MKMNRPFLTGVSALALMACGGSSEFSASLTGAAVKPAPVTTNGSGSVTVKLDGNTLEVSGRFTGLLTNVRSARIHGPADENNTAEPLCQLGAPQSTSGTLTLGSGSGSCKEFEPSGAQVSDLENGRWYVILENRNHEAGEVRGQLRKKD
ncbi:CHRD domain-containing protein [Stigmatella sp. ncwal1]|uniref:CHRD domain-containing protein n=1 Tax=Stigmatella ashevillensis TaxID=2995309 RepID=A0ABT5D7K7_9BACT|nr:CHRD domain-containing protein [Stigmatella ashevillena]MDC0709044.1 CHRD domain-containing protein [Stigmatella ashevillena]